ncbi:MAG: DUF2345 domain-containing protein [Denitromonas halophila]|nr:MAG: DUF2345 domain-containing protein [Denitromonas halophila]TVT67547.1 MAG: DUF2345 domain-containing protein [Denitromonas halophila]
MLAGAIRPGDGNTGITLIAAKDDIEMQAQSDEMAFQAKDDLELVSIMEHIDFAAGKRIVIATEGGASITIDGGITVECPGTITVHASKKSFGGPAHLSRDMNSWPATAFDEEFILELDNGEPAANRSFEIRRSDGALIRGVTDAQGKTGLQRSDFLEAVSLRILPTKGKA